eukprot:462120-Amphidinium_carterae.1
MSQVHTCSINAKTCLVALEWVCAAHVTAGSPSANAVCTMEHKTFGCAIDAELERVGVSVVEDDSDDDWEF